jgi:hypothetical protein
MLQWASRRGPARARTAGWFVGAVAILELLFNAYGVYPQCDPWLYYPRLPLLQAIAQAPRPGRVCGINCLPASLNQTHGLLDVRGYDAADPARIVELLELFRHPDSPPPLRYARVQWWVPKYPSPLADLLGLRYLIMPTPPPAGVRPIGGYWLVENKTALPRAFVPHRAQTVNDKAARLARLADPNFRPADLVLLESDKPVTLDGSDGTATIREDLPERVTVQVNIKSPGVLVLADQWDPGWTATYNGRSVEVLPADHALRGVVLPAGKGTVVFRYQPASFTWGVRIFLLCGAILLVWSASRVVLAARRCREKGLAARGV